MESGSHHHWFMVQLCLALLFPSAHLPLNHRKHLLLSCSPNSQITHYIFVMDIKDQFPSVHWIWKGGISFVYEVDPRIAVKVPQSGEEEREQFSKEVEIYRIFSQNPPCPFIVQCFHISDKGIFLEYMRGVTFITS